MPASRTLKVFRISAGFEDAYIAASSQKAALEAWGAKRNLFAQGAAEHVTDPDLVKAALAHPGEVLRVPRGTTAEHLAAAGTTARRATPVNGPEEPGKAPAKPKKPRPRPKREKLDAARARLEQRRRDLRAQDNELAEEIDRLKARLAKQRKQNATELAALEQQVEKEERRFRKALATWEG
jgi:hypothetical protein